MCRGARELAPHRSNTNVRRVVAMDWYAWLCKAGLNPDLALQYALLFARNELGAADVRHLDHDFLATMGVAVAKHRLEILKHARKDSSSYSSSFSASRAAAAAVTVLPWRATRLLAAAVHRRCSSLLAGCLRSVARLDSATVAPRPPRPPRSLSHRPGVGVGGRVGPARWKSVSMSRRGIRLAFLKHASKPMLTNSGKKRNNGTATLARDKAMAAAAVAGCFASTETCSQRDDDNDEEEEEMDGGEEIRWESMFQDLNPT